MVTNRERDVLKTNAIREGLPLSDGSWMKVLDAHVVAPRSVVVATGWRSALLVKVARWRMSVASALAGVCAGWFEFYWWQFVTLAGGVVVTIKLGACVSASWWYRKHLLVAPPIEARPDGAATERWLNDDRNLASRWLGQGGWMEVMPMDYDYPLVDWSTRVQTFVPWALAQFAVAGLVWGTVMWLLRSAILALSSVALLPGTVGNGPANSDEHEQSDHAAVLLRTFDALCVGTRFDEAMFHASVSLFGDANKIADDDLRMMSPDNTAGYYLRDRAGGMLVAAIGLTRSGEFESRNCGITSRVAFDDAKALVLQRFRVTLVDQFHQGTGEFALFEASLVGYAGNIAISVQGGYELSTIAVFELRTTD